jgi:hypothetical protein
MPEPPGQARIAGRRERLVSSALRAEWNAGSPYGVLRCHKEVQSRLVGEIPKTLTNHQLDDVERIVRADLART